MALVCTFKGLEGLSKEGKVFNGLDLDGKKRYNRMWKDGIFVLIDDWKFRAQKIDSGWRGNTMAKMMMTVEMVMLYLAWIQDSYQKC